MVVEGNVAFDNKGHCFVVESGMETGNVFRSNLGACSKKTEKILPQAGASGKDSDESIQSMGQQYCYWIR
jgi:hypothetical protein